MVSKKNCGFQKILTWRLKIKIIGLCATKYIRINFHKLGKKHYYIYFIILLFFFALKFEKNSKLFVKNEDYFLI